MKLKTISTAWWGPLIGLLDYPKVFDTIIKRMRFSIFITGIVFALLTLLHFEITATSYLICAVIILNIEITYLNFVYYGKLAKEGLAPTDEQS